MYTPEEVERVRAAGKIAAGAIVEASKICVPGTTTDEIDVLVHEYICDHGAYPSTVDYRGYPKSVCTSLNEVICHGIPDSTVLEDGDILNLDVTAYLDGMHGDTNKTLLIGNVDEESRLLVERTEESLNRAIKAVKPGRQINVIGRSLRSMRHVSVTAWFATTPVTVWVVSSTRVSSSPTTMRHPPTTPRSVRA